MRGAIEKSCEQSVCVHANREFATTEEEELLESDESATTAAQDTRGKGGKL